MCEIGLLYQKSIKFACNYFRNTSAYGGLRPQAPTEAPPLDPAKGLPSPDPLWFCPIPNLLPPPLPTDAARQLKQALRDAATICPASYKLTFDLLTLKVVSESRVTDVGYLCANLNLPRPLCSRLRPDIRDRQTDVRRTSSLDAPTLRAGA